MAPRDASRAGALAIAVAVATACGSGPGAGPDLTQRAHATCTKFQPQLAAAAAVGSASADTAGSITRALGDRAIEPWRSLPKDHFVARCGYLTASQPSPRMTTCPNGERMSLEQPVQFLVDESGRSTAGTKEDVAASLICP